MLNELAEQRTWIESLDEEDLMFIKRFVLASGSLKELAAVYGISYPTVRQRLDRLIEVIKVADSTKIKSEFERTARQMFAAGQIDLAALKRLLAAHRREMEA